jgi:hypothetical protein
MELLMADIFDQVAQQSSQPAQPAQSAPASAAGATTPAGDIFDQVASGTYQEPQSKPPAPAQSWLDKDIPLTSHTNATLSGLQSVAKGIVNPVKGIWDTLTTPPKDKTETAISAVSPIALPIYRTFVGAGHTAKDATQIVQAIHDINSSPDPLYHYAKAAQDAAGEGAGQALLGAATEGVLRSPAVAKSIYKGTEGLISTKPLQTSLKAGVQDVVKTAAEDAGVDTSTLTAKSIRRVTEEAADAVKAQSQADYQALDEASGGRIQRFRDKLEANRKKLMNLTDSEEDKATEASILKNQKATEDEMHDTFDELRSKGVNPDTLKRADANFRKSQALYDLDNAIKKSTTGAHPDVSTQAALDESPETLDIKGLHRRVNALHDSGRLQDALGEEGASDLFDNTAISNMRATKVLRNRKIAEYGAAATPVVGSIVAGVKHYMGH